MPLILAETNKKIVSTTIKPETLINQLNWRCATKQFDPKRKINADLAARGSHGIVASADGR